MKNCLFQCLFIPNCTRNIMQLLSINNIHVKISRWLSRRNARISHNQGKIVPSIAPSRACSWFASKRFDWSSVSFFDPWRIRMLGLLTLFCNALNQSEWRNFFLHIIRHQDQLMRFEVPQQKYYKVYVSRIFQVKEKDDDNYLHISIFP